MAFMQKHRMKYLLLWACIVVRTSKMKISCRPLAENCMLKRAACAARLFFFIQPMKSLICGIGVAIIISKTPFYPLDFIVTCSSSGSWSKA